MKQLYFVWQGGDGGDFLMQCINKMLNNNRDVLIDKNGASRPLKKSYFLAAGYQCWRCHVPWRNNKVISNSDAEIIWLHNKDPEINIKKHIYKRSGGSMPENLPRRHKKIVRGASEAVHKKDLEKVYYFTYTIYAHQRKQYATKLKSFVQNYKHTILNNNMIHEHDIHNAIQTCFNHMQIQMPLLPIEVIEQYAIKQKELVEKTSSWQYIDYPL
jgi:hypothetical protein